jgi:hypothetical protein
MGWYSKEQPTPFDALQIGGLCFQYGNAVSRKYGYDWCKGEKLPIIALPSGTFPLHYTQQYGVVAKLGQVAALPLFATSDEALETLQNFTSPFHCEVYRVVDDDHQIQVHEGDWGRIYFITYDDRARQLMDVMVDSA